MYTGRLIFSQLMDHLPMPTFRRCVERYQGDRWVKSFRCVEHYRCMAFAQLTYRESLRDIEACLRAQGAKLYHMGIRGAVSRSTLADANEQRDWRIYADFAQRLIHTARRLYVDDALALELDETVYALDSSTIDLCLTLFPWADFRKTKAAVKLHTLLDLRGSIPAFIHISTGKLHDVNVMDLLMPEAAPSTSWTGPTWTSPGSTPCTGRTPSSSCAPNPTLSCAVFTRIDRSAGVKALLKTPAICTDESLTAIRA